MAISFRSLSFASLITLSLGTVACAGETAEDSLGSSTLAAALEVNQDGGDVESADPVDGEPLLLRECGLERVGEVVRERYDADRSGEVDAGERERLEQDFPPPPARFGGQDSEVGGPPIFGRVMDGQGGAPFGPGGPGGEFFEGRSHGGEMRGMRVLALLHVYDADHDGQLSEQEQDELEADLEVRCDNRLQVITEEFDSDGDGALSEEEWETASAALRARFEEHKQEFEQRFDADADGVLSESEREAARQAMRDEFEARRQARLAAADTDGDGTLSESEHLALVEELRAQVRGEQRVSAKGAE
jgi:Ca2+-binding EF-hand superfamily protein